MKNFAFWVVLSIPIFISNCSAQNSNNPKYLGEEYGRFDLAKVTFEENLDTLFSKVQTVRLTEDSGHFDEKLNKYVKTDTIAYVYKIKKKKNPDEIFKYRNLTLLKNNRVRFKTTTERSFGFATFSTYTSKKKLDKLIKAIENNFSIKTIDKGQNSVLKNTIIQFEDKNIKTTIGYSKNTGKNKDKSEYYNRDYFIEVEILNKNIKNKKFVDWFDKYEMKK